MGLKTKLNTILLVNNPPEHNNTDNSVGRLAYNSLIEDIESNYHHDNRIILLRYSFDSDRKKRIFTISTLEEDSIPGYGYFEEKKNFGNVRFTEMNFLGLIFSYINSHYQSERSILITWGHGYGFGIYKDFSNRTDFKLVPTYQVPTYAYIEKAKLTKPNKAGLFANNNTGQNDDNDIEIKKHEEDYDKSDVLSIFELAKALQMGYQEIQADFKLDLILFMNCEMMRLDTIYDLSFYAKHIVGPETPISWIGYNYAAFLKCIHQNIDSLNDDGKWKEICKNVIDNFKGAYDEFQIKYPKNKYSYLEQGARSVIAAIETKNINEVYREFNNILYTSFTDAYLNEVWLNVIKLLKDENLDASNSWNINANSPDNDRNSFCYNLHNFDFINLLCSLLEHLNIDSPIRASLISLIQTAQKSVFLIKKYDYAENGQPSEIDILKSSFSGISINLMRDLFELEADPYFKDFSMLAADDRGKFVRYSFWPEFLATLYKIKQSSLQKN